MAANNVINEFGHSETYNMIVSSKMLDIVYSP